MRILWASDFAGLPSGYANVTRHILERLKLGGHEVIEYSMQPIMLNQLPTVSFPYPIVFPLQEGESYGSKGSIFAHIQNIKPDIVVFLTDSFLINWFPKAKLERPKEEHKPKYLFYFPFDSDEVYNSADDVLKSMDILVAMSKFGQNVCKRDTGLDAHYIPHGVDTNIFRPLRKDVIEKLREENHMKGKFVVGSVSRNQSRKNLPHLMEAFAEFAKDKPDTMLFLHCDPHDPQGHDLVDLAKRLKLDGKVIFGMKHFQVGVPEVILNQIYNCFDVHFNATTGEGFGLPTIESMAAGIPNIITDCTTSRELIGDHGLLVSVGNYVIGQYNTHRAFIDKKDAVDKLNFLHKSKDLRELFSKKGMDFVRQNFNWEKVGLQWLELLDYGEVKSK